MTLLFVTGVSSVVTIFRVCSEPMAGIDLVHYHLTAVSFNILSRMW